MNKYSGPSAPVTQLTLRDVLNALDNHPTLPASRKRDLRSAVAILAKQIGRPAERIVVDLDTFRNALDLDQLACSVSRKRLINLRSDLSAALEITGLIPMLRTAKLKPNAEWAKFLDRRDLEARIGISRLARWASLRGIPPCEVNPETLDRFEHELTMMTLVPEPKKVVRGVIWPWNRLAAAKPELRLTSITLPVKNNPRARARFEELPASFVEDKDRYLKWCASSPLDENGRDKALAPRTIGLQEDHIHSAMNELVLSGIAREEIRSLADLVNVEAFRRLLRNRWEREGRKLSSYTHGMARTLVSIASSWSKLQGAEIAELKTIRRRLGPSPSGLTEKNKRLLRLFDDPKLVQELITLPDKIWRSAGRELKNTKRRRFIELQSALGLDVLLYTAFRMGNMAVLNWQTNIQWPEGKGKPARAFFRESETKNRVPLEFELPLPLADRLLVYRDEIVPAITGERRDAVFVTWEGTPRTQEAITLGIENLTERHLGVRITPHQYRHLAAKFMLDENPGEFEPVRQFLGHKNLKTTTNSYTGVDTLRAGRAHARRIKTLKERRKKDMDDDLT